MAQNEGFRQRITSVPKSEAPFVVGTAISVWQNSGGGPSNWETWCQKKNVFGASPILGGDKPGKSCDFWNFYEADIARNAAMGCTALRMSLEWHRIEPQRGEIDRDAIAVYHKMLDVMEKWKMTPLFTLHHFVHPQWFEDLGGFEKESNIQAYLDWVELAFRSFGKRVRNWNTFNEPGVYTFSGYFFGTFPPGKVMRTHLGGIVVKHMLMAHCRAYNIMKGLPGGSDTEVGLVHNQMPFQWYRGDWVTRFCPHVRILVPIFNAMWGNKAITDFMATGELRWRPTGPLCPVTWQHPGGPPPLDYIGLNFYSRIVVDWKCQLVKYPDEVMGDMDYAIWPQGFYEALKDHAALGKPIIVTETGFPDHDDSRRELWATSYIEALENAVAEGADVRGLMYWTLTDNFEWAFGFKAKFGLYEWNSDMAPGERNARPSTKLLRRLFKELPGRVQRLKSDGLAALRELRSEDSKSSAVTNRLQRRLSNQDDTEHLLGRVPLSHVGGIA